MRSAGHVAFRKNTQVWKTVEGSDEGIKWILYEKLLVI